MSFHQFYIEIDQLSSSLPCALKGIFHLYACTEQLWCWQVHLKEGSSLRGTTWGCSRYAELPLLLCYVDNSHIFVSWWLWVSTITCEDIAQIVTSLVPKLARIWKSTNPAVLLCACSYMGSYKSATNISWASVPHLHLYLLLPSHRWALLHTFRSQHSCGTSSVVSLAEGVSVRLSMAGVKFWWMGISLLRPQPLGTNDFLG